MLQLNHNPQTSYALYKYNVRAHEKLFKSLIVEVYVDDEDDDDVWWCASMTLSFYLPIRDTQSHVRFRLIRHGHVR